MPVLKFYLVECEHEEGTCVDVEVEAETEKDACAIVRKMIGPHVAITAVVDEGEVDDEDGIENEEEEYEEESIKEEKENTTVTGDITEIVIPEQNTDLQEV